MVRLHNAVGIANLVGGGNLKLSLILTIQVGAYCFSYLNVRQISQSVRILSVE